jgi:diguanylate cyclase (GGDEF)-like protein/PAS domain S-box-containing protein
LSYRHTSIVVATQQPGANLTVRKGIGWLGAKASSADIALVSLISLLSLVVAIYGDDTWRLQFVWLMLAPACGLVFGLFPALAVSHTNRKLKALSLDQEELVGLLLKDYAGDRGDWLWSADAEGNLRGVSEKFAAHVGQPNRSLEGLSIIDLLRGKARRDSVHLTEMMIAMRQRKPFFDLNIKVEMRGQQQWWRLAGRPTFRDGRCIGFIGTASDITAEVRARESVNQLAFTDGLTGLSNRSHFSKRLDECCKRLERYGTPFAVFYLDLDRFKAINDTRGHRAGDQLLIEVGRRLGSQLRETDTIARLGGDEFAVILPDQPDKEGISIVASRLIAEVEKPFELENDALVIGLSIGIAQAPDNGKNADEILHNADLALYRAKGEGGNRHCFFEPEMDREIRERQQLEREMAEGLQNNEFVLHYLPIVSASEGMVTGFEALVRWKHPTRGLLQPSEFLPVAERSTLICALGDWTIRQACRMLKLLPEQFSIAVNISTKHFQTTDVCATVLDALKSSGADPKRLELEIKESLLLGDKPEVVRDLREQGVGITLDDFGAGLSGLSHLLAFPGEKVKIDRTFVDLYSSDPQGRDVLRAAISLAHSLNLAVVAEGIETEEQATFFQRTGCDFLQGFYFAKTMPATSVAAQVALLGVTADAANDSMAAA